MKTGFDQFVIVHRGEFMNFGACCIVLTASWVFAILFHRACDRQARTRSENGGWHILTWSFGVWMVAWMAWFVLYGVKLSGQWLNWDRHTIRMVVGMLSNQNSVWLLFSSYALACGHTWSRNRLTRAAVLVAVLILAFDVALTALGCVMTNGEHPNVFLLPWSAGLSILTPVVLGCAFVCRYKTTSVLFISVFYAALQPFAYGALYLPANRTIRITLASPVALEPRHKDFIDVVNRGDGQREYRIPRCVGPNDLTGVEARAVLRKLRTQSGFVKYARAWLQLRFEDLVFSLLALMKLLWASQVIATVRNCPTDVRCVLRCCERPVPGTSLVIQWKWFYWPLVFVAVVFLCCTLWFYGIDFVVVLVLVQSVLALTLIVGRGGRPLVVLAKHRDGDQPSELANDDVN